MCVLACVEPPQGERLGMADKALSRLKRRLMENEDEEGLAWLDGLPVIDVIKNDVRMRSSDHLWEMDGYSCRESDLVHV